jgi:hypothetical protein
MWELPRFSAEFLTFEDNDGRNFLDPFVFSRHLGMDLPNNELAISETLAPYLSENASSSPRPSSNYGIPLRASGDQVVDFPEEQQSTLLNFWFNFSMREKPQRYTNASPFFQWRNTIFIPTTDIKQSNALQRASKPSAGSHILAIV